MPNVLFRLIEGGCQVPIGVHAVTEGDAVSIEAIIASLDGSTVLRDTIRGQAINAAELGKELGNKMLDQAAVQSSPRSCKERN